MINALIEIILKFLLLFSSRLPLLAATPNGNTLLLLPLMFLARIRYRHNVFQVAVLFLLVSIQKLPMHLLLLPLNEY
jgi:hypothetical protein